MDSFSGYIGTYTQGLIGRGKGIYAFNFSTKTGNVENIHLASECVNPSYLALSSSNKYLYAVNEISDFEGSGSGAVSSFSIDERTGVLKFINQKISNGKDPCHIVLEKKLGKNLVVSNYTSGTLSVFPIMENGALGDAFQSIQLHGSGKDRLRQEVSHAHFFAFDKNTDGGFACDLGGDSVIFYSFNEKLSLKSVFISDAGAGPRHGVFHSNGKYIYILNELNSTIDVLEYAYEKLERKQSISTLPRDIFVSNTAAGIKISPCENFLYASNRGHNSISIYRILLNGSLEFIDVLSSYGETPRDFAFDPSGNFLLVCHQDSDNLVVFRIDKCSGLFERVNEYYIPSGVCIVFLRLNLFGGDPECMIV